MPSPSYHARPARGWLNDPNGIVHLDGRWHVFFQHNPAQARHGHIHWGHVSSPDLVTWREHPVAFGPQPGGPDRGGCWSGVFLAGAASAAVAYTGVGDGAGDTTVCVRYAVDEGLDGWSEPLVVATQPGAVGLLEMRDPYLFDWDGRRFALLGAGLEDGTPALLLYSCDDLQAWRFERVWLTPTDLPAGVETPADIWECPQLLEVDGQWVLALSLLAGGVLGDVVYLVGDLESAAGLPRYRVRGGGLVDTGPSMYAPQAVPDRDGPLLLGWVRQEGAPDDAPLDAVAGCLTLPRRLSLVDGALVSVVDPAVRRLAGDVVDAHDTLPQWAYLAITPDEPAAAPATVRLVGSGGSVLVAVDRATEVWLDGDVVEVYPAGAPAATYRVEGAAPWRLQLDDAAVRVRALEVRIP